ncbi:MAG: DinB family protein [candidate division Zixibacteria bacterium]|nr:DinB family protein [candidate division Zixibacteria bacterium]MDD5425146.1 DinB family protein [candidate division Zixibacteria bacterium]
MFKQTRWIDRKFELNYPVGVFPCVVARIKGTPARLEEIAASLTPELLTAPVENGWTIQENIGHLIDSEALFSRRLNDYLSGHETLQPASLDGRKTAASNHNARDIKDILRMFRMVRGAFVTQLEALDENMVGRSALHPRLNIQMRLIDMVYLMAEHDDFHIARIYELIEHFKH